MNLDAPDLQRHMGTSHDVSQTTADPVQIYHIMTIYVAGDWGGRVSVV